MTVRARVPAGICPRSVQWTVEYLADPDDPGSWQSLSTQVSEDSVQNEVGDGGEVYAVYGAAGLVPGRLHRVQVAHSCGPASPETPTVTCLSECPSGDPLPACSARIMAGSFGAGTSSPAIPQLPGSRAFSEELEDTFTRPATRPKRSPTDPGAPRGDGLGPDEIWHDDWGASAPILNGAFVGQGGYAVLPLDSLVEHKTPAQNEHSFVEVKMATDQVTSSYNIDLRGRRFSDGSVIHFYFVKFARNLQSAGDEPDLILNGTGCPSSMPPTWACKTDSGTGFSWVEMGRWTIGSQGNTAGGTSCTAMPALGDSTETKVWLRLEVEDDDEKRPVVRGALGWNADGSECPAGATSDLSSCQHFCQFTITDTSSNASTMKDHKGQWGIWAHEKPYRLHVFRAGSGPGT